MILKFINDRQQGMEGFLHDPGLKIYKIDPAVIYDTLLQESFALSVIYDSWFDKIMWKSISHNMSQQVVVIMSHFKHVESYNTVLQAKHVPNHSQCATVASCFWLAVCLFTILAICLYAVVSSNDQSEIGMPMMLELARSEKVIKYLTSYCKIMLNNCWRALARQRTILFNKAKNPKFF